MGRTACTESQCLYNGALYLYLTVELYLYSIYGTYGLYRVSVPVQGCTLPLPYSRALPLLPLWALWPVQSLSACTRVHFSLHYLFRLKYPLFLSHFDHTSISLTSFFFFERYSNIKFHENPSKWEPSCSMRMNGHDETNSRFSQCSELD